MASGEWSSPPQVAVLGPTQTGKSTLVNVLLGHAAAEVSPLAGFTVHPQGFWVGGADRDQGWTSALFPDWRRVQPDGLTRDDLASYCADAGGAGGPRGHRRESLRRRA